MRQHSDAVGFGDYLRDAILAAGFSTPTQFAREVGTDPSVVLRWISGEQRPTISSIERIAPVLGRTHHRHGDRRLPRPVGPGDGDPGPAQMHPLAYELGRILADDSPVPPEEREALASVLDRLLEPYRRDLRRRRPGPVMTRDTSIERSERVTPAARAALEACEGDR